MNSQLHACRARVARPARRRLPLFGLLPLAFALLAAHLPVAGQNAPEPRREQLLNGLRLLIINRPGDPEVLLRARVHSGAAFDLADKEGLTALLGDALFDANTREFVRGDLDGRLEVSTGYDYIDITLAGRASDFERFVDLVKNGLTNTQLSPDVVAKLREARIKAAREAAPTPSAVADRAAAARLFGKYPYGRSIEGTPESLARVERADLMLARERFLNPNNTTLVIIGGVEPRTVMRLLRQNLGAWTKSDRVIPSTFRQPEAPDARTLVIDSPGAAGVEVRLAVRGLARADRDAPAVHALVALARARWAAALPELRNGKFFVRHDARTESGIFLMGATLPSSASAAKALDAARKVLAELAGAAPAAAEFETARQAAASSLNEGAGAGNDAVAEELLVEHTYKTRAVTRAEIARSLAALTPAEAQRVAARLFLHTPVASVAVGEAARLSEELARAGGVEVFGAQAPAPSTQAAPTSPTPAVRLKRP